MSKRALLLQARGSFSLLWVFLISSGFERCPERALFIYFQIANLLQQPSNHAWAVDYAEHIVEVS